MNKNVNKNIININVDKKTRRKRKSRKSSGRGRDGHFTMVSGGSINYQYPLPPPPPTPVNKDNYVTASLHQKSSVQYQPPVSQPQHVFVDHTPSNTKPHYGYTRSYPTPLRHNPMHNEASFDDDAFVKTNDDGKSTPNKRTIGLDDFTMQSPNDTPFRMDSQIPTNGDTGDEKYDNMGEFYTGNQLRKVYGALKQNRIDNQEKQKMKQHYENLGKVYQAQSNQNNKEREVIMQSYDSLVAQLEKNVQTNENAKLTKAEKAQLGLIYGSKLFGNKSTGNVSKTKTALTNLKNRKQEVENSQRSYKAADDEYRKELTSRRSPSKVANIHQLKSSSDYSASLNALGV